MEDRDKAQAPAGGAHSGFIDSSRQRLKTAAPQLSPREIEVCVRIMLGITSEGIGIDLSVIRKDKWMGRDVYVVGAKQGDSTTPQVWVDKKGMYFVRLIQQGGRDKKAINETQFNKYVKAKGGWVAAEVIFLVDGKKTTTEDYTDIQADVPLDAKLWDPQSWMTVDRSYYKKK